MTDLDFHSLPVEEVVRRLETDAGRGLPPAEVATRVSRYGWNELSQKARAGLLRMLFAQFNNFLVIILVLAAVLSLMVGEVVDATAIAVIVVLNAVVGVFQESKAEAALAALKRMAAPNAQVIRGGHQQTVPSRELVPGDLVVLEAGNYVPADLRLVESVNLKVDEASLTGESVPADKSAGGVLEADVPLGDRKNSAFMSTLVTYGRGRGIVTGTGMGTQIGLIAEMLQSGTEEATPLQRKLDQLGRTLGTFCLAVCAAIFVYGLVRHTDLSVAFDQGLTTYLVKGRREIVDLFMTAVSLAIAAVPEGLPAVVTICLALGMQKMIRRHALIRKLPAVETLGCATVICSDKTGTLTQNEMTAVQVWTGGRRVRITGEGYSPKGGFLVDNGPLVPSGDPDLSLLLRAGACCSDATLEDLTGESDEKPWRMVGDPTEGALVVAAAKAGFWRRDLDREFPRIGELPFDSDRKRMTTVHRVQGGALLPLDGGAIVAFVKGAPDVLLGLCVDLLQDGRRVPLSDEKRAAVLAENRDLARQALRVLAVAVRPLDSAPQDYDSSSMERDLTFVGLLGMIDPARPEVAEAVKAAHGAGLRTVMVTGDYKDTAEAIAAQIGLLRPNGQVLTGADLDRLTAKELARRIDNVDVCCRVSPAHKTKIVEAFKTRGHVVAMTGDGVNDAPALKRANIGIAMGITGTDVSKGTADMVLTDDNFSSIVSAIEEGRVIYSNIRKFVFFLISCNLGEIFIIFLGMLLGLPVPLKPIQLLLLNLVTDGAPALALGMEKGDPDVMKRPPRPPEEPVINREMEIRTVIQAVVMTVAVLGCYAIGLRLYPDNAAHAQTMAYAALCMSELMRAFTVRSEYHGVLSIGVFSNQFMVWATAASATLVLLTVYVPFLRPVFDTVPLSRTDWLIMAPFIPLDAIAAELTKVYFRRGMPADAVTPRPG